MSLRMESVLILAASVFFSSSLTAATLTVDLNGGADYTDIQAAIDAAVDGDTVLVKPGEYVIAESISFKGKGITVHGEAGPEATTIRMAELPTDSSRASVVIFENGESNAAVLEGLTLTGGNYRRRRRGAGAPLRHCGPAASAVRGVRHRSHTGRVGLPGVRAVQLKENAMFPKALIVVNALIERKSHHEVHHGPRYRSALRHRLYAACIAQQSTGRVSSGEAIRKRRR